MEIKFAREVEGKLATFAAVMLTNSITPPMCLLDIVNDTLGWLKLDQELGKGILHWVRTDTQEAARFQRMALKGMVTTLLADEEPHYIQVIGKQQYAPAPPGDKSTLSLTYGN